MSEYTVWCPEMSHVEHFVNSVEQTKAKPNKLIAAQIC